MFRQTGSRQTGFAMMLALLVLGTVATGAAEAHSRRGHHGGHYGGHHGGYHGGHGGGRWQCFDKYPKPVCYRVSR